MAHLPDEIPRKTVAIGDILGIHQQINRYNTLNSLEKVKGKTFEEKKRSGRE